MSLALRRSPPRRRSLSPPENVNREPPVQASATRSTRSTVTVKTNTTSDIQYDAAAAPRPAVAQSSLPAMSSAVMQDQQSVTPEGRTEESSQFSSPSPMSPSPDQLRHIKELLQQQQESQQQQQQQQHYTTPSSVRHLDSYSQSVAHIQQYPVNMQPPLYQASPAQYYYSQHQQQQQQTVAPPPLPQQLTPALDVMRQARSTGQLEEMVQHISRLSLQMASPPPTTHAYTQPPAPHTTNTTTTQGTAELNKALTDLQAMASTFEQTQSCNRVSIESFTAAVNSLTAEVKQSVSSTAQVLQSVNQLLVLQQQQQQQQAAAAARMGSEQQPVMMSTAIATPQHNHQVEPMLRQPHTAMMPQTAPQQMPTAQQQPAPARACCTIS